MFFIPSEKKVCTELYYRKKNHFWSFFVMLWGLKITNLANLGQLTRYIFWDFNVPSEISSALEIVPY